MGHTTFQATLWFTLWLIYVRITPLPHRSNVTYWGSCGYSTV